MEANLGCIQALTSIYILSYNTITIQLYQELHAKKKRLYTVQRGLTVPRRESSYCAIIVQCRVQASSVNATWLFIVTPTRISYGFINVSLISCIYTESIISLNSLVIFVQFLAVSQDQKQEHWMSTMSSLLFEQSNALSR